MNYRKLTIRVGNVDKIDHSLATLRDLMQRGTVLVSEHNALSDMCSILQALKNAASEPDSTQRLQSLGDEFTVQSICLAYEQGVGQWDRGLRNPYRPPSREHEAYALGVAEGKLQQEYPRKKLTEQEVIAASKETIANLNTLATISRLLALRPVARELKQQRVTEEEYHKLPEAVKAYFTLVEEGQEPPGECVSYPLDGIKPVTQEEYKKRSAADALSVRDGAWTWSVPVDDDDTVRGSTEDGWAATVALVEGKGWHVTTTLTTSVGNAVYGTPCRTREHGMLTAQTKRSERMPHTIAPRVEATEKPVGPSVQGITMDEAKPPATYTPPDVGCVRCGLLVCGCEGKDKA